MSMSSGPAMTFRRLMVFIDGTNFLLGCANYTKDKIDKFLISVPALERNLIGRAANHGLIQLELVKTFYYGPKALPESVKNSKPNKNFNGTVEIFKKDLVSHHVRLILKDKIKGKEKNIDAALVTDMLSLAYSGAYDYAVLVSGDADFISAIDEIKRFGKIVSVAAFKEDFNEALLQHVDKVIYLNDLTNDFIIQQNQETSKTH